MDAAALVTPPHIARPLRLLPFQGLMLAPGRIGDVASSRAFARPYREVAARLTRWERRGQVRRDEHPAVYLHEYTASGITVRGLVGALDISRRATSHEQVAVFPHEGIHPAQADELAARMAEMGMNPAPILLVHRGPAAARDLLARVRERAPDHAFRDRGHQEHRIWAIRDPAELRELDIALEPSRALIADGHHRYAAYLRLQQRAPGTANDAGLAMLVDQEETPLFLGAIHRVLHGTKLDGLAEAVGPDRFRESDAETALAALAPQTLVATDGRRWGTLRLDLPEGYAAVEVLHDRILAALRPLPTAIDFHHSVETTLAAVRRRPGVAVLMPAPDFGLVLEVALADRLLPEKATSFQPKPNLGVLIRSLRDG